jgi:probable rRNA maturation factor
VLSFRQDDGAGPAAGRTVGDIVISVGTVRRNADGRGVPAGEELARVAVHGLLHLAGMDHGRGRGGEMLALQEALVERLGDVGLKSPLRGRPRRGRDNS